MKINKFEFTVERGEEGLWYVKSPQVPGLFVAAGGLPEALEEAAQGIRDLALAFAWGSAEGETVKPIFEPATPG